VCAKARCNSSFAPWRAAWYNSQIPKRDLRWLALLANTTPLHPVVSKGRPANMMNPNMSGIRPQIILLRDGTDTSQGKGQLISNINACQAVAEAVRTTLGPRGMDKLIVSEGGKVRSPALEMKFHIISCMRALPLAADAGVAAALRWSAGACIFKRGLLFALACAHWLNTCSILW
jgi:hypothetical protein